MNKTKAQLIIQTAFLGDCILTFPLAQKLIHDYPDSKVLFLCRKGMGSFIKSCFPNIEPIEVTKSCSKSYKKTFQLIKSTYDLEHTYCVHRSMSSLLFAKKLKAKKTINYTNSWRRFVVSGVKRDFDLPEAVRILQQHALVNPDLDKKIQDWKLNTKQPMSPKTRVPEHLKVSLPKSKQVPFDIPDKYVVIAPGSVWETKKWPAQKFASLSKLIKDELDLPVILLGAQVDEKRGKTIRALTPQVIDLIGQTSLVDCKNIISNSTAFIGNDSGLVHMAALFDIPSVAVFGPTHEALGFKPWQNFATISSLNLGCSPCGTHGGNKCPIGTHDCMNNLSAQLVFSDLKLMLNKKLSESTKVSQIDYAN